MTTPSESEIRAAALQDGRCYDSALMPGRYVSTAPGLIALYRAAYAAGMERAAGIADAEAEKQSGDAQIILVWCADAIRSAKGDM